MWIGNFWMGEDWIFLVIIIVVILFMAFSRGCLRIPWGRNKLNSPLNESNETPLETLKHRYANGEITKEEFDKIKNDLL